MDVGTLVPRRAITLVIAAILLSVAGCTRPPVEPTPTIALSPTDTRPAATTLQAPTPETTAATTGSPPASATLTPTVGIEPAFSLIAQSGGTVDAVALDGNIAYLGIGPRLALVDISDPAAPRFLGQSDVLPELVQAVAVQSGVAYVDVGRGDLHLFDVTDPGHPVALGTPADVAGPERASWVDIFPAGGMVYAVNRYDADGGINLAAIDVSDLLQPDVVERRDLPLSAAVAVSGDVLYIASEGKLLLVDAADLDHTLGEIALDFKVSDTFGWRYSLAITGRQAYIGVPNQPLQVVDVSNPAQPQAVAAGQPVLSPFVRELVANDEYLFLLDRFPSEDTFSDCPSVVRVYDFSDVASPRLLDEYDPQGCAGDIDVDEAILAVAGGDNGLQIIDAGDPATLTLSSEWVPPAGFTSADNIALNRDVAYITSGDVFYQGGQTRLLVLDRSQAGAPTVVGDAVDLDLRLGDGDARVYVRDDRLYIIGTIDPMALLDTSEPARPQPVAHELQDARPVPAVSGDLVYAAVPAADGAIGVVDLSDPANPVVLSTFLSWPEGICNLSITDRYLVAASCAGSTSWLYDLDDPANPAEVGQYELWSNSMPLAYADVGGTLFYLDGNALYAQDISDPAQLDIESNRLALELPFEAEDMVPAGDTLYISGHSDGAGIWAVDVGDMAHPSLTGHVELPEYGGSNGPCYYACGLAVEGDLLYAARDRAGLYVFHLGEGTIGEVAAVEPAAQSTIPPDDTRTAATPVPRPLATRTPVPTALPSGEGGIEVAYALDGELTLWNEVSNQSRTIYSEGGVVLVVASEDGKLIAFTRRWIDFNGCNQLALWVVGPNGENPRELVSPEALREQFGFGDTWKPPSCANTFFNFYQLMWLPQTHQLLYSLYPDDSHTYPRGIYLVDADSADVATLVPAGNSARFAPSPDGRQVALLSTTALGFINADGSEWRHDVVTYPESGIPTPIFPNGVWTQDGRSFLLVGPVESESGFVLNYTIRRVPDDGAAAQPLVTLADSYADFVAFSPDGTRAGFPAAHSTDASSWAITPLDPPAGAVAAPTGLETAYARVQWSPEGTAYAFSDTRPGALDPLCPEATQASEVCGDPITLGEEGIAAIRWIDGTRFVLLTGETQTLSLGRVDGTVSPIAEGVGWGSWDIVP